MDDEPVDETETGDDGREGESREMTSCRVKSLDVICALVLVRGLVLIVGSVSLVPRLSPRMEFGMHRCII